MKKTVLLGVLMLLTLCGWAQQTMVSGTVLDADTHKAIVGASVTTGKVSVVTNDDGFFTLKSEQPISTIRISHLGYRARRINVSSQQDVQQRILLRPATIQLSEVFVTASNARELVEAAMSRIPENYSLQKELYSCFYREKVLKRHNYISVAEGVIDMYKNSYKRGVENDRVAIRKGRRLLSAKRSDTLSVKVIGGPTAALRLDIVKNADFLLNEEELNRYELKLEVPTMLADRPQYVISLSPRATMPYAMYYGKIYIDQQSLAFTRFELELDMSDREKATALMLVKKPRGLRFKPKELSCIVDYRTDDDGITRISYISNTFRFNCDWKRKLFATSFTAYCEMAVTSHTNKNVHPIRGRDSFDQCDAFFDQVDYFRDPTFWQDYNIIEPTESLDKVINKLLKKHR